MRQRSHVVARREASETVAGGGADGDQIRDALRGRDLEARADSRCDRSDHLYVADDLPLVGEQMRQALGTRRLKGSTPSPRAGCERGGDEHEGATGVFGGQGDWQRRGILSALLCVDAGDQVGVHRLLGLGVGWHSGVPASGVAEHRPDVRSAVVVGRRRCELGPQLLVLGARLGERAS